MIPDLYISPDSKIPNVSTLKNLKDCSDIKYECLNFNRDSVIVLKSTNSAMNSTNNTGRPECPENARVDQPIVRRGRPKASSIPYLQQLAANSNNPFVCSWCKRIFLRRKALNTHVRIHTHEKPYLCTYPSCVQSFTQSSHLDTHIRIHTGEKPFRCSVEGCTTDFCHQSRHCKLHPGTLKRKEETYGIKDIENFNMRPKVEQDWLIQYFQDKENKASNIRKRKVSETTFAPQTKEKLVSNSQRNEQSESDELVIQESQRLKRKRILTEKENVDDTIHHAEHFSQYVHVLKTETSSFVSDESNFSHSTSDPSSSPNSSLFDEDTLEAANILLSMKNGV